MEALDHENIVRAGAVRSFELDGIIWHANDLGAWCYREVYSIQTRQMANHPMIIHRHEFPAVRAMIAARVYALEPESALVLRACRIGHNPDFQELYVFRRETRDNYFMRATSFARLWESVLRRAYPH